MTAKKITVAPQNQVEPYEDTARLFFREVLDYSFDDCLITDESWLSDFSFPVVVCRMSTLDT